MSTNTALQSLFAKAVQHYQASRLEQADAACRKILVQDAGHPNALHMLAVLAMQSNRLDDSEQLLRQALTRAPNKAEFLSNLGDLQLAGGRDVEAIATFQRVVDREPDNAYAWHHLAGAFSRTGRSLDAIACHERFIVLNPGDAGAHYRLGAELVGRGQVEDAITRLRQATVLQPDYVEAHVNLGVALRKLGRVDEAADQLQHAINLKPEGEVAHALLATAHNNLGIALQKQGRLDEATAHYRRAIELNPDMAEAHTNLAMLHMLRGQFAEAWPSYEWRFKLQHPPLVAGEVTQPQWDGSDIAGKTLLLHAEQGLGDTLQFIRYVEPLAARGARLVLVVTTPARRLLEQSPLIARHQIIAGEDAVPPFDLHCPLLSVPLAMQTRLETIPCGPAYLQADDADVAAWRTLLAGDGATLRIGIAWAGSKLHGNDHNRSMSLAQLSPLFEAAGDTVSFYSLQKGDVPGQAAAMVAGTRLRPPPRELDDLADTAALMMNLDLINSVDTSVAHLAGGLGRPVWTLLPLTPIGAGYWTVRIVRGIPRCACSASRRPVIGQRSLPAWRRRLLFCLQPRNCRARSRVITSHMPRVRPTRAHSRPLATDAAP